MSEESESEKQDGAEAEGEAAVEPVPPPAIKSALETEEFDVTGDETIVFDNKVFSRMEGSYFRKSEQSNEPVFVVSLGGEEVTLPFKGLSREFGIEPTSHDDKMLRMIVESLDFVNFLVLGDNIPKEILTGEASWEVTEEHRRVAYQRLSMQLVAWMSGGEENQVTDPEQLLQIADDPATKQKVSAAFDEAAKSLGYGDGETEKVIEDIEELAEEIAFIETLREKFRDVQMMEDKLKKLKTVFGRERSVQDLITPVARLIVTAREELV